MKGWNLEEGGWKLLLAVITPFAIIIKFPLKREKAIAHGFHHFHLLASSP